MKKLESEIKRMTAKRKAEVIMEIFTPYTPEQNGMIERFFRTIKEECIWHHNFKNIKEANEIISRWIKCYNQKRKHSALGYKAPAKCIG